MDVNEHVRWTGMLSYWTLRTASYLCLIEGHARAGNHLVLLDLFLDKEAIVSGRRWRSRVLNQFPLVGFLLDGGTRIGLSGLMA